MCDRVAIIRAGRLVALEDVAALLARRKRHVELRFRGPAPELSAVPGVSGIAIHDNLLTCQLEGDVGPFLAALAGTLVADLTIEPAHLEEAFLEFYEGEGYDEGVQHGEDPPHGADPAPAAGVAPTDEQTADEPTPDAPTTDEPAAVAVTDAV